MRIFRYRLLARGYTHKFIGAAFSSVKYSDRYRFLFERHDAAQRKSSMALTTENKTPALIALSLQHSQRADALGIARAIFFIEIGISLREVWCPRGPADRDIHTCSKIGGKTRGCSPRLPVPPGIRTSYMITCVPVRLELCVQLFKDKTCLKLCVTNSSAHRSTAL